MRQLIHDLSTPIGLANLGKKLYHNAQYLTAVVEVDEKKMARWLPSSMKLAQPARADLFCAYFPENVYTGAYHEAGLFIHIQVGNKTGIFCPWMILNDDRAMIIGRELLGYPKKIGEIAWDNDGTRILAKASRRGTTFTSVSSRSRSASNSCNRPKVANPALLQRMEISIFSNSFRKIVLCSRSARSHGRKLTST